MRVVLSSGLERGMVTTAMNDAERRAILEICLFAAFADGGKSDLERGEIQRVAESVGGAVNLAELYHGVLLGKRTPEQAAAALTDPGQRAFAYEMAVSVIDADDERSPGETAFLERLRGALQLGAAVTAPANAASAAAHAVPLQPAADGTLEPVDEAAIDKMVLNYAILNGALELLPQSLATAAIIPLQMKMVYRVGKRYGYTLDRGHIRDFLATAGVGMTSQIVESYARRLVGGLAGQLLGGLGRAVAGTASGAAFTFASTYALGHLAKRYYAGGRRFETAVLRDTYQKLLAEGRGMFEAHGPAIRDRARGLDAAQIAQLVRQQ